MDVRDMAFWLYAARRQIILNQIRHIQAVRAGMATNEYYIDRVNELKAQLNGIDETEVIQQNWDDLKAKKRG